MPYLKTYEATDWDQSKPCSSKVLEIIKLFIPEANPGYEGKMHLLDHWLIEFDDKGLPVREIGLAPDGAIVLAGPSPENYGFWCDTNMKFGDFDGEPISREEFENAWVSAGVFEDT